jgi:GTPase SAR1 family protein
VARQTNQWPLVAEATTRITDVQSDVTTLLKRTGALLERVGRVLGKEAEYAPLALQMAAEGSKIEALELRLAVVAPMKAGKSTILNALMGDDLLPSRNTAMTTLPTRVVHDPAAAEPVLWLRQTSALLAVIWQDLLELAAKQGPGAIRGHRQYSPDFDTILTALERREAWYPGESVHGRDRILETLVRLNDVFRLACVLQPQADFLRDISKMPTPELRARFPMETTASGSLAIIDTPGPNDPNLHPALRDRAANAIQDASLLLLVLDYTALNNTAAEELQREVKQILEIRGRKSLFVVVNKVDQRDDKGLSREAIKKYISCTLGLHEVVDAGRVFELSARRAFRATMFQRVYVEDDEACRNLPAAQQLAALAWPEGAEEELQQEGAAERLRSMAVRMRRNSGLDSLLGGALETLAREAAPRALQAGVEFAQVQLRRLASHVAVFRSGIAKQREDLDRQIQRLNDEIGEIQRAQESISGKIEAQREQLDQFAQSLARSLQQKARDIGKVFVDGSQANESFFKRMAAKFNGRPHAKDQKFANEKDAIAFANDAKTFATNALQVEVDQGLEQLRARIITGGAEIEDLVNRRLGSAIERARSQFREQFDVDLELAAFQMSPDPEQGAITRPLVNKVDGGYATARSHERRWYTLGLWRHEVEVTVKHPDQFLVSLNDVADEVYARFLGRSSAFTEEFSDFLRNDFIPKIKTYFDEVRAYLTAYSSSLEKSQAHNQLSLSEREAVMNELRMIDSESRRDIEGYRNALEGIRALVSAHAPN